MHMKICSGSLIINNIANLKNHHGAALLTPLG